MINILRNKLKVRFGDSENGFTLLELMVTIIIVGILVTIAIPIFLTQQRMAVEASVKSDVASTRAFVPYRGDGLITPVSLIESRAIVSQNNVADYWTNTINTIACLQVTHEFSPSDLYSYYYDSSTGITLEGTCENFVTLHGVENLNHVQILPGSVNP